MPEMRCVCPSFTTIIAWQCDCSVFRGPEIIIFLRFLYLQTTRLATWWNVAANWWFQWIASGIRCAKKHITTGMTVCWPSFIKRSPQWLWICSLHHQNTNSHQSYAKCSWWLKLSNFSYTINLCSLMRIYSMSSIGKLWAFMLSNWLKIGVFLF